MSFIAITYGYNQYSIFNTNTTTLPLIDTIRSTCLSEINNFIEYRKSYLTKELSKLESEITSIKKDLNNLEKDKQREEERIMEMSKQMEPLKKGSKTVGRFIIIKIRRKHLTVNC
jgi:hypothetical protein